MDIWLGVLLAAPGMRIGGGPPAAGGRSPCSWILFGVFYQDYHSIKVVILVVEDSLLVFCIKSIVRA